MDDLDFNRKLLDRGGKVNMLDSLDTLSPLHKTRSEILTLILTIPLRMTNISENSDYSEKSRGGDRNG